MKKVIVSVVGWIFFVLLSPPGMAQSKANCEDNFTCGYSVTRTDNAIHVTSPQGSGWIKHAGSERAVDQSSRGDRVYDKDMIGAHNTFVFDPKRLRWYAYNNAGRLVRSGRASGGRGYCPDVRRSCRTPVGAFRIYSKRGAACRSSKYPLPNGGARMPYCMFFYRGFAIHGSYDLPNYNASHGCIRVLPKDAAWLSAKFLHHGAKVIVKSYGKRRTYRKRRR